MSVATRGALAAINHLLSPANWARERLAPHAGRHALVRAEPFELLFAVGPGGYVADPEPDGVPSVTLSFPLAAVPKLLGDGGAEQLMSAVRIDGNAEFADALGFVFRNLRWDVEEDLSRLVGDILARRTVLGAQSFRAGASRAWQALGGNLAEYLTDEQPLLVPRDALSAHGDELSRLRDDLARLEKRAERLAGKISSPRVVAGAPTTRRMV
jgi:ubiquinone biosynthesis accessory factor UbiJ